MTTSIARMRELQAADGHAFDCWRQAAEGERRGGIVILQEIFGVTEQLKGVAARYAARGYEVAIPALFDRHAPATVVPFAEALRGREIMQSLDEGRVMADVAAAVESLAAPVAVIGFCWGGGLALEAAQSLDIVGAVAFYGTRLGERLDKPLRAPMLFHFGARDDHSPPEVVAAVRAAFPEAETHEYDCGHAFANDARDSYVADAAALAHERSMQFLDRLMPA